MELEIIYRDEDYIAINKPSGLLVHRSPIDRHETRFAIQMLRDQIGQHVYPVHRLDKPTSGILIFGLSKEAGADLHKGFAESRVDKTYLAICRGYTPDNRLIDHPVKAVDDKRDKTGRNKTRDASTILNTLARCELDAPVDKYPKSRYSLVKLNPLTGRRHQLRYHMKHISHPIIGDAKYGRSAHNRFFRESIGSKRLLLAATELSFQHPYNKDRIHLKCKPTSDFIIAADNLGWRSILIGLNNQCV